MVAGKAYFAVIPPQICVGYAAARKKHSACKLSFRQQPEHRVRFFSEGRIAAPHNVCGTAAAASRLRHSLARQCLQGISSPQGNSTAGKNLRYSVLRDISRRRFKKTIIGTGPWHLQRVRAARKIGNRALLIRPHHKIVHWTVLLSFKFSQV